MRLRHRRNLSRYSSRATGPAAPAATGATSLAAGHQPRAVAACRNTWQPVGIRRTRNHAGGPAAGRRRRARHASPADQAYNPPAYVELAAQYGESGRRSRHSAEHRDHDIGGSGAGTGERPPSPPMAPPPPAEPTRRHRTADTPPDDSGGLHARDPLTGGQSVADLMARLQVESTGGGRRRRRGE